MSYETWMLHDWCMPTSLELKNKVIGVTSGVLSPSVINHFTQHMFFTKGFQTDISRVGCVSF